MRRFDKHIPILSGLGDWARLRLILGGSNEYPPATVSSYTVVVSHLAFGTLSLRSINAPRVAALMECVDFMQPRWPSRISTFNSIFCRSFRFGTGESVGGYRSVCAIAWLGEFRRHSTLLDIAAGKR